MRCLRLALPFLVLAACDDPKSPGDPVRGRDAAVTDAAPTPDAAAQDAAAQDATTARDAGFDPDAGVADTGVQWRWPVPTTTITITRSPFWKNSITPDDTFRNTGDGTAEQIRWVKFAVLMRDPRLVYFQDSAEYPFHYDFATAHLDPFAGDSRSEFDDVSLHAAGQEVILGAVLFAPKPDTRELGIQLVRQDAYDPQMVRIVFEKVVASIQTGGGWRSFYFPTFEQAESTRTHRSFFENAGIEVSAAARWSAGHACYAHGWALGRLTFIPGDQIDAAYADGRLSYTDILVTDGVPAEVPLVAGILSLSPSTPSSHVAILAESYGVPFVHLAIEPERSAVMSLAGRRVALRANSGFGGPCDVRILDASGLSAGLEAEILDLKAPPNLTITPKATRGALWANTDGLLATDIQHFGGKATNFALVRTAVPNNSPAAIALSFDLWDGFMAQTMPSGDSLLSEIAGLLANHVWPPDVAGLRRDLEAIRTKIKTEADFDAAQQSEITSALAMFDPMRKIRFRSSTNVEDSDQFTGAGLYDSYSGCLADDTDADEVGPSRCDPMRMNERGVFRALRKVYASFYNDNAFIERLRHGLDESQVAMAVLVHHSFPDVDELANGVAKLGQRGGSSNVQLVTQAGAVSVANPTGDAIPEVVTLYGFGGNWYPSLEQRSSLVPLGGYVLDWESDYTDLAGLLKTVADRFAMVHPPNGQLLLDLEYKKIRGDHLVIKQVRKIPQPDPRETVSTFLLDAPGEVCTFQGEYGDVLGNHRLKSRWTIGVHNTSLGDAALASTYLRSVEVEYLAGASSMSVFGDPSGWPNFSHSVMNDQVTDAWSVDDGGSTRQFALSANATRLVRQNANPLFVLSDFFTTFEVSYSQPVPTLDWSGQPTTTDTETVRLGRCPDDNVITPRTTLRDHDLALSNGRRIHIQHYWPEAPTGATAGYTAPLHKWAQTTVSGFTSQPITLRGFWSQTYRPGHHNFSEDYVLEPRLEAGVDPASLAELEAANTRLFVVKVGDAQPVVQILGTDGRFRRLR